MTRFLVFTLAAPLMALGDIAPGERRVGADRPGHSALIGLLAAALGLGREDPRQSALARDLAFAVRVDAPGEPLVDYHTTQAPPARRNRRFATRKAELALPKEELNTILSQRAYRADAAFTVAAIARAEEAARLEELAQALARPRFVLHAGRKACPLGLPPAARIVEAADLPAAFAAYDALEDASAARRQLRERLRGPQGGRRGEGRVVAWDAAFEALAGGLRANRRETRRDMPVDRRGWRFALREEHVGRLAAPVPESGGGS